MIARLESTPTLMVDFIMRFRHQMTAAEFAPSRAYVSAITIGLGYFMGGFIPLVPYFFLTTVADAFIVSILLMVVALFVFGCLKTVIVS